MNPNPTPGAPAPRRAPPHRAAGAVLLALSAGACSLFGSPPYDIAITPPPPASPPAASAPTVSLTLAVTSTYAPFVDGGLSPDRYARDGRLGREDAMRYRDAFAATRRFADVQLADAGAGLHCRLAVVSGREPPRELRRVLSQLLTLGLLSHVQHEVVQLEAIVTAPGRPARTYRLDALVTTDTVTADHVRLRRTAMFCGPEHDLAAALAAHLAHDGWLATTEAAR